MKRLNEVERERALQDFVECIKIPTVSGNGPLDGSYDLCATWLLQQFKSLEIDAQILPESLPHKPLVVGVWPGLDQNLPGILLNSHYDVVPVVPENWTVPAFEGLRKDGKVYGRGTQDMKCVCVQYLVSLRKLKSLGYQPLRNIYLSYVPDEEIGGAEGMSILLASQWYSSIKIGLALDEGLASENSDYSVFYGERLPWWVRVKAQGNTGHASRFIEGTAVEQLLGVTSRALQYRESQRVLLHGGGDSASHSNCSHSVALKNKRSVGDVTSLNITVLRAGVQAGGKDVMNVVPVLAEAGLDIRISPHTPTQEIAQMLDLWCEECSLGYKPSTSTGVSRGGVGLSWEFAIPTAREHATTSTDEAENPWWGVFRNALTQPQTTEEGQGEAEGEGQGEGAAASTGVGVRVEIFPAATDSRFLRALGVRALGFSPMRHSPILLHEHDEHLEESVFLEGCEVYVKLIEKLASQDRLEGIE